MNKHVATVDLLTQAVTLIHTHKRPPHVASQFTACTFSHSEKTSFRGQTHL
jgi:hypothetical protein